VIEPPASVTPQHKEKEVEKFSPELEIILENEETKVQNEDLESKVEPSTNTTTTEVKDDQPAVTQS
jgi:hypothetical protein